RRHVRGAGGAEARPLPVRHGGRPHRGSRRAGVCQGQAGGGPGRPGARRGHRLLGRGPPRAVSPKPSRRPPPRRPSTSSSGAGLGGEQVEGRRAVRELLAGRRAVRELLVAQGAERSPIVQEILDLAASKRVAVRRVSLPQLDAAARTDAPQGVVARAAPLAEADLDDLARARPGGPPPFLVVLDGVTDPHNLGAVLRTAEVAGATGAVLPRHRAAHVSPTATKAAAGAIEHLPLALVAGIAAA